MKGRLTFHRSESCKPDGAQSEIGWGSQTGPSHAPDDQAYQQDLSSPATHSMGRQPSNQGDFANPFGLDPSPGDSLAGIGAGTDQFGGRRESSTHFNGSRISVGNGDGMAVLCAASQHLTSPVNAMMLSPTGSRHHGLGVSAGGYGSYSPHPSQYSQMQLDDAPPRCSHLYSDDRSPKRQKLSDVLDNQQHFARSNADGEHRCRVCGKVKRRECDLR